MIRGFFDRVNISRRSRGKWRLTVPDPTAGPDNISNGHSVSAHGKFVRPISWPQFDGSHNEAHYVVDRGQAHSHRVSLGVLGCILGLVVVDVDEVIAHARHAAAIADIEVSQSVRVESLHEDAARKDGISHARGAFPLL